MEFFELSFPERLPHGSTDILATLWVIFCQSISIKCTEERSEKSERLTAMFEASLILLNGLTVLLWEGNDFKLIKESEK